MRYFYEEADEITLDQWSKIMAKDEKKTAHEHKSETKNEPKESERAAEAIKNRFADRLIKGGDHSTLPEYAKVDRGVVVVDTAKAMPAVLAELGVRRTALKSGETADKDTKQADQYWLAVAREVIKLDIQVAVRDGDFWPANGTLVIEFSDAPEWALDRFPKGRGELAATKGREARSIYTGLRGYFPE